MSGAVNLRDLFFENPARAADAVTEAVLGRPDGDVGTAVGTLGDVAKKAALSRLTEQANKLLEQDVTEVFCRGWEQHTKIRDAATATLAEPDEQREVNLDTHAVSFTHEPHVELWLGERKLATVAFEVRLEITINALQAGIRAGRLVEVSAGSCDVEAGLTVAGTQVAQRQVTLPLPLTVRLPDGGWPLVEGARLRT